jgi:hypothetical protein
MRKILKKGEREKWLERARGKCEEMEIWRID